MKKSSAACTALAIWAITAWADTARAIDIQLIGKAWTGTLALESRFLVAQGTVGGRK